MRSYTLRLSMTTGFLLAAAAGVARADVCVTVDQLHDTFSAQDRAASLLLVARELELAGEHVVPEGCPISYAVSHASLGHTIVVTVSGPNGQHWKATALGMDELPALYNQMVRSMVTRRPMTGFKVVDRTNVTASQMSVRRVRSDSFGYALLGFGRVFGNQTYRGPNDGIGYRAELDSFGVDVAGSLLRCACGGPEPEPVGLSLSLGGLYFLKPGADATPYVGGGLGRGSTEFSNSNVSSSTNWHGSGLQGKLIVGYEVSRASTRERLFVQVDAVLPFYRTMGNTVTFFRTAPRSATTQRRYTPSLSISAGISFN